MGRQAPGARDPRRPENIDATRRQERAYALFIAGLSYQAIAESPDPGRPGERLYSNKGAAHKAVAAAMARHSGLVDVEEMRRVEGLRIDALQRAHWGKALQGDSWATLRIKELMEHRAKLFGLYQPVRTQIEVLTTDTVQAAIDQLTREIAAEDALNGALDGDGPGLDEVGEPVKPRRRGRS